MADSSASVLMLSLCTTAFTLALTYLEEGATSYVASPTNWPNVIAVRMALTLEGKDKADGKTISRNTSNVISLRSRTP